MSLNQDLLDAGVNLSDMARESHFQGESYGNLYEVLRKERLGLEIKSASQVKRLELLRSYLAMVTPILGPEVAEEMKFVNARRQRDGDPEHFARNSACEPAVIHPDDAIAGAEDEIHMIASLVRFGEPMGEGDLRAVAGIA